MNRLTEWKTARNLLGVRLDNAGDILLTVPAIRALKKAGSPGRKITLLCSSKGAAVCGLIPEIDDLLVYDAPWMKATAPRRDVSLDRAAAQATAARRFDGAVIFSVYSQNPLPAAFFCYLCGIPRRAGFCRENPYQLLTRWIPDPEPERFIRHEVQRQLALVSALGAQWEDDRIKISIPSGAFERIRGLLAGIGLNAAAGWIALHAGASAPSRRYPAGHFARVCDLLSGRAPVVFTGSAEEKKLIDSIRGRTRARTYTLAGKTDLAELAAFISLSALLISNNTCTVHLASATGTSVVDLYALTNPQHTPWKVANRVLYADVECKYCYKSVCPRGHHDCLSLVSPQRVAEAALELLEETSVHAGDQRRAR